MRGDRRIGPPWHRRRVLRGAVLLLLVAIGLGAAAWLMFAVMATPLLLS